jgi:hypothetical protein
VHVRFGGRAEETDAAKAAHRASARPNTSVWVAEHGWTYLIAIIDCCTREIVAWQLELRCRADEAIAVIERAVTAHGIEPGRAHARLGQRLRLHGPPLPSGPQRTRPPPPPRRLPRPGVAGLHRELVRETERTGGVAERVRDARRRETRHRRLRRPLPPPPPQRARPPDAARSTQDLGGSTENRGLRCQLRRGAGHDVPALDRPLEDRPRMPLRCHGPSWLGPDGDSAYPDGPVCDWANTAAATLV